MDEHFCFVLDQDGYCSECGVRYKECFWCGTLSAAYHTRCMSCAAGL